MKRLASILILMTLVACGNACVLCDAADWSFDTR